MCRDLNPRSHSRECDVLTREAGRPSLILCAWAVFGGRVADGEGRIALAAAEVESLISRPEH